MDRVRRVSVLVTLTVAMIVVGGASLAVAAAINGNEGDNKLTGTVKRDVIRGFAGEDKIDGRRGNDVLYGNDDSDFVTGGGGNDRVYGNRGDDLGTIQIPIEGRDGGLSGGKGNDAIYGGPGDDTIYDENGENFVSGGSGSDEIVTTDFSNDRDRIDCGKGRDVVLADDRDRIADDCEVVYLNAIP